MVPGAAGAVAERDDDRGLTEPTFWGVLMTGLPGVLREGFLPLGAFYAGLELSGLVAGIVASALASVLIYLYERSRGRDALLVRLSLLFVAVQSIVGLVANSATVYLAQPVVFSVLLALAYVVSVAVGRPLIGVFASAWYPFPRWFRESEPFRREFSLQTLVWAAYMLLRAALRLWALLHAGIGGFVVVSLLTGLVPYVVLVAWGLWHARRSFSRLERAPA